MGGLDQRSSTSLQKVIRIGVLSSLVTGLISGMRRTILIIGLLLLVPLWYFQAVAAVDLEDIESIGYLEVKATPDGARVYFDGRYMGFTETGVLTVPVDLHVTPKWHDISVEYTGYKTFIGPLPKMVAGKMVTVQLNLNPEGYEQTGIIEFQSIPPGTEFKLNGASAGTTPDSGWLIFYAVPVGMYQFEAVRPGNQTQTDEEYVGTNAVTKYHVNLLPSTVGDIGVNSTPVEAGIYIDNRYIGITPLDIPDITIGDHKLIVKKEGYQDWSNQITVVGNMTQSVEAVLVSIPTTPIPTLVPCVTYIVTPEPAQENSFNPLSWIKGLFGRS